MAESGPGTQSLLRMYELQRRMVACDEVFRATVSSGRAFLIYYSPRGQECVAAAAGVHLRPEDYMVTTYRGLHDQIAKGIPLDRLVAEYFGRESGACGGKGGPMHVADVASGVMLTTGIVGAGLPVANGLAMASMLDNDGRVVSVSFGDGATNTGAFHEALNLAALWKLPVVFLCQNNGYGEHTPVGESMAVETIAARAAAYGMPGVRVDGNDPVAMWAAYGEAVDRARRGEGPTLIDAATYRFWGHLFGDAMEYMPEEERMAAMDADPVVRYRAWLISEEHAGDEELAAIDAAASAEVEAAFEHAFSSSEPDVSVLTDHVLAGMR